MNKKLFCLASLAALTLAGCGETPEPPEPVDPILALQARFVGLGESYKATLSVPGAGEAGEDASLDILVNADYLFADVLGL